MKITQFGNSILREKTNSVPVDDITDVDIQSLINQMRSKLTDDNLGIGLAATQVGVTLAVAVIEIHKTLVRLDVEPLSLTIINPVIIKTYGSRVQMWEGCISSGAGKAGLFAKVPRHKKIELEYLDENAQKHIQIFEGLAAHVIQHEVDHLNGVLFVDKVKDTKTFLTLFSV